MTDTFDWIIVGAGPAGSTLAARLAPAGKVLLLERRDFGRDWRPGMPGKCCGGLLAPDAQRALAELGLSLPVETLGGPQIFAVKALDFDAGIECIYQRFYLNLDREKFDRWLAGLAVASGADLHCRAEFLHTEGDVAVYRQDGRVKRAAYRYLIGADGAASRVRRQLSGAGCFILSSDCYVAIQERFAYGDALPWFSAFFDSSLTDFYGWTIPKSDGLLCGAAFRPGGDAHRKFDRLKAKLAQRGMELGTPLLREGALLRRPSPRQVETGHGKVFLIGEAAGWISPSSAEGFSYAFTSARILSEVFLEGPKISATAYRRACRRLFWNLHGKNCKMPVIYQPFIRKWIMRSGLTALHPPQPRS